MLYIRSITCNYNLIVLFLLGKMTGDQHIQLGKKSNIKLNLGQIKSGISAAEFKGNDVMLNIFNSCDTNKNTFLEDNEVSVFKDKLTQAAGEDAILSESEAKKLIKQEQQAQAEAQKAQGQAPTKTKVKAEDLYNFANQLQTASQTSKVKSSVVEGDKRVITYEDGAQEVINKDGSKVITTISGAIRTVQTKSPDGKLLKEENFNEETGVVEEFVFGDDGKTVKSHTRTSENARYEIGTEGLAKGRITKEIIGKGEEQQVVEYNYTGENDFTKNIKYKDTETSVIVENGKAVSATSTQYDENHNKLQSVHVASDGTETKAFYQNNNVVLDVVTDASGKETITQYNESGQKLNQQITTPDGKVQVANYDGQGNTIVVVQNGETIGSMGQKFNKSTKELVIANKGHVYKDADGNPYFLVGHQAVVPGEYPANHKGLQNRNSSAVEINEYATQEAQRVAERLEGKEQKAVTVDKDYDNWYRFAEEQLKSEGVENPTTQQINDRTNELLLLNPNVEIPKAGLKVVAIKTDAELEAERIEAERQHADDLRRDVVNSMVNDYNTAVKSFNNQMDKDGWAADAADAISYIWNNPVGDWLGISTGNTASQVREDLDAYGNQVEKLRTAYRAGEAEFKAEFKRQFGVEYSQEKMERYQNAKQKIADVTTIAATEQAITSKMDGLFASYDFAQTLKVDNANSNNTYMAQFQSPIMGAVDPAEQIKTQMQEYMGLNDDQMKALEEKLASEGKSMDVEFFRDLYSEMKTGLAKRKEEILDGKSLEQYQKEMQSAYKDAYGNRNDIVARVDAYNHSQDVGAAVVKTGVTIVGSAIIAVASGGTATGLVVAALGTSALSFGVEATDMLSDNEQHSASEYLTAGKNAAIDGVAQLASGGMSKFLKGAQVATATRYVVQAGTDVAVDLGSEYLRTGEVNMSTAIMSAVSSIGGEYVGDLLDARRARKEFDLGDIDEAALARKYGSVDQGWINGAEGVEAVNPEHSRYVYTVTAEQMGGGTRYSKGGIDFELDAPRDIQVDISSTQRKAIKADVAKLRVKGEEFVEGLETLEAIQVARNSHTHRADGVIEFEATKDMGKKGSGVSTRSAVTAPGKEEWRASSGMREDVYQTLSERGIIGDSQLVEDCANMSQKAYGKNDPQGYGIWQALRDENDRIMTVDSAAGGFHADAYIHDGKIVVAFRGSDAAADLPSDFSMLAGSAPEQLEEATDFVKRIKQQYPNAQIVVTGHSLGGSLAEMVASKYEDVVGITFDAVGTKKIVEATGGALVDNHNTVNYIVQGDVISNADAHVGQTVVVSPVTKGGQTLSPHAIQNFTGNSSALEGVEKGILAKHVAANTDPGATRLSRLSTLAQDVPGSVELDKGQFRSIKELFEYDVNTVGANLDDLEAQIKVLSDPAQRAQLQSMVDARRVAITSGADIKANTNTLRSLSGDEVNDILARDFGFTEPGFLGGDTPSAEIVTNKPTKFVRVYNDESSFARGTWLMPYDEVVGLTPAEIKDKFALPAMPKYIVEVEVPEGTKMFTGKCNPLEGWGKGGGTQYFVTNNFEIPTQFDRKRLIAELVKE